MGDLRDRLRFRFAEVVPVDREPLIDIFDTEIAPRYSQPERTYHNLQHLEEVLHAFDKYVPMHAPREIELALWFHDAVYEPMATNNEERSADLFLKLSHRLKLSHHQEHGIKMAIMATKHDALPMTIVDKYVVDADLSILGAEPARFDEYERQVRAEFTSVTNSEWKTGRTRLLQSFLDREWIFSTFVFRGAFEAQARKNLKLSLARLSG